MENAAYHIEVKLSIEFLRQLLPQADEATDLVLIGDLSKFRAAGLSGVAREEIAVANTVFSASHGRVHIPLTGLNKYHLKKEVLPQVGIRTLVREVQMERYGRLLFSAPDHFHCGAWLSNWFQLEFLQELEQEGVVRVVWARPSARLIQHQPSSQRYSHI
jgi:hypothetical protein